MKTEVLTIHPTFPEKEHIERCAGVIRRGGLVVFPTETVYGIAADLTNPKAIARLKEIKQRPEDKPFTALIAEWDEVTRLAGEQDNAVYKLMDMFWPGPLTVILNGKEEGQSVGLRMPDNVIAQFLVRAAGCALAAPSANVSGQTPPVTCAQAMEQLDGLVDVAIDGGPAVVGRSSTVLDTRVRPFKVVREGPVSQRDVDRVVREKIVLFVCTGNSCRSVMAEYLLRKRLGPRDDVKVISAGTGVFVPMGASSETLAVLRKEGIDASGHRSRPLERVLLKKADLIFVMTRRHREQVLRMAPAVEKRVYLLREFASGARTGTEDLDIPDPMGRPMDVYEECAWVIKEAIQKVEELI